MPDPIPLRRHEAEGALDMCLVVIGEAATLHRANPCPTHLDVIEDYAAKAREWLRVLANSERKAA